MLVDSPRMSAFQAVARLGTISAAAEDMHLTQPALSARIANLEDELGMELFVRHRLGVELTAAGQRLLTYCRARAALEGELLEELHRSTKTLSGSVTVASYSALYRSIVVPVVAQALRAYPEVHIELRVDSLSRLPQLLESGTADFVLMDSPWAREGVEFVEVGREKYVLIAAKNHPDIETYWEVEAADSITTDFYRHQKRPLPKNFRRNYARDLEAIVEIVAQGLGRAVVSKHLLKDRGEQVRILRGYTPLEVPVFLHTRVSRYRTRLHEHLAQELGRGLRRGLGK